MKRPISYAIKTRAEKGKSWVRQHTTYEERLYPPGDDGLAETTVEPVTVEVLVSNFHGNHQVYLRLHNGERGDGTTTLHLTRIQARELADALGTTESAIAYDNTQPTDD